MSVGMWLLMPVISLVVVLIITLLVMWFRDSVNEYGIGGTLVITFVILAIASAFGGLFFLE